jgi:hypothetical protein
VLGKLLKVCTLFLRLLIGQSIWQQAQESNRRAEAFKGLSELCTVAPSAFNSEAENIVTYIIDKLLPLQSKTVR